MKFEGNIIDRGDVADWATFLSDGTLAKGVAAYFVLWAVCALLDKLK